MNYYEMKFAAKMENVLLARATITTFLLKLNQPIAFLNEVKTIVSEAIENAIEHGYKFEENKEVVLKATIFGDELFMEIIDEGIGIDDIKKAKEPMYSSSDSVEKSGLGFTIMEVFSDTFEVETTINGGTTIKVSKKFVFEESHKN